MSIITNIISPIIQATIYIGMFGWGIFLIWWVTKKLLPNLRWTIKYKILRRKFKDADVSWCIDAVEKDLKKIEVKKFLLLKGLTQRKVSEMMFIYERTAKEMKGGINYDRQFEESDGEIEKNHTQSTGEREIKG